MFKTPEAEFDYLFERMHELCEIHSWGDPFSYARAREIHMANRLGHTISKNYSGSDAVTSEGILVEYKSTIGNSINATYNGISVQPTWDEQVKYLKNDKIAKYPLHFFSRYSEGKIKEIWKMDGTKVYELLLPKIKKQYDNTKRKDPRLGASLSSKEIKNNAILHYFTDSDERF